MDPFTAALIASVIGGGLSAAGNAAGANAQANAAKDTAAVNWNIYEDQARRNEPWRQTGLNALNFQSQWLGLPGVSDNGASFGGSDRLIGGGGDQWTAYLNANPDLQTEWSRLTTQSKNPFKNPQEYAQYHYNTFGRNEGRELPAAAPAPTQAEQQASAATNQANVWDTIKRNPLWTAATEGFLGVDVPEVNNAFATSGKVNSGAQKKALYDRSTARSYNALGDIYNQYGGMSGAGFTATQATNQAGSTAATNAGNAMMARGNALASGYQGVAQGIGQGLSGISNAYFMYGQGGGGSKGSQPYTGGGKY